MAQTKAQLLKELQRTRTKPHSRDCVVFDADPIWPCDCSKLSEERRLTRELTTRFGKLWQKAGE